MGNSAGLYDPKENYPDVISVGVFGVSTDKLIFKSRENGKS